jgi:hypothetical protein
VTLVLLVCRLGWFYREFERGELPFAGVFLVVGVILSRLVRSGGFGQPPQP